MTYNIEEHPLFDIDNVSVAINSTVKKMSLGDKAFLDYGDYKIKDTLIIENDNNLEYCDIRLLGVYNVVSADLESSVKVKGDHLTFHIDKLTSNDKSDYYNLDDNDILPGGVSIGDSNYGCYSFKEIVGFEFGIRLCPTESDTGLCFNKVKFQKLSYCYIPFLITVPNNFTSWINENQFFGGTLKGYYGVVYKKGNQQIDEFNNNTFYNFAFEAIETDAITADFCAFNTFISPRFEFVNRLTISESETCKNNKYYISVDIPLTSINIESKNTSIFAPIYDRNWKNIVKGVYTDSQGNLSYDFNNRASAIVKDENVKLKDNVNYIDVYSETQPVKITLSSLMAFNENSIMFVIHNQKFPIILCAHNGKELFPNVDITTGTYKLFFKSNNCKLLKLSNMVPYVQ